MNESRILLRTLAWRSLIALPFFIGGWVLLSRADNGFQSSPLLFFGMALMTLSAIIVGPTLTRIVAQPGGSVYYPSARYETPQPVYSIPRGHRVRGEFQEAFDGFKSISEEHPQLVRPYAEMMDIALSDLRDRELADAVFEHAQATLRGQEARDELSRTRKVIRS